MAVIVAGADGAFGYKKSGNAGAFEQIVKDFGQDVKIIEKEKDDFHNICFTLIRSKLDEGDMKKQISSEEYILISGVVEREIR